jgi:hypothetical protein
MDGLSGANAVQAVSDPHCASALKRTSYAHCELSFVGPDPKRTIDLVGFFVVEADGLNNLSLAGPTLTHRSREIANMLDEAFDSRAQCPIFQRHDCDRPRPNR